MSHLNRLKLVIGTKALLRRGAWLSLIWWLVGGEVQAQPQARLHFTQDSVALGEQIELTMEIAHAPGVEVYFPSRRRDFVPFDFVRSEPAQTRRSDGQVIESVVYRVRTFDLAPRQAVRLPYRYQSAQDTALGEVLSDTVVLVERIPSLNDTLKYRLSTEVYDLGEEQTPYRLILLVMGAALGGGVLVWLLRRPVQLLLRRRRLHQEWQQVRRQVLRLEKEDDQRELFDQLSDLWKHWMDPHDRYGLPSMTTTELETRLPQLNHLSPGQRAILLQASRDADRTIYAGQRLDPATIAQHLHNLVEVMQIEYKRRDREMRRGEKS